MKGLFILSVLCISLFAGNSSADNAGSVYYQFSLSRSHSVFINGQPAVFRQHYNDNDSIEIVPRYVDADGTPSDGEGFIITRVDTGCNSVLRVRVRGLPYDESGTLGPLFERLYEGSLN